jgi:ornithine lipid ester-linked acyl 2-hydroxylase
LSSWDWAGLALLAIAAYSLFVNPILIALGYNLILGRFIENPPIVPEHRTRFPWTRTLEEHWREIRAELDDVLARQDVPPFHRVDPAQLVITRDEKWRTYFLKVFGEEVPGNCVRCPRTAALIRGLPEITTAMFSVLEPGKVIPAHRGPFRGVFRYHLGLLIPADAERCWMKVGGERHVWHEGEGVVFDDTFTHQVENATDERRVVLFLDFVRPLPPVLDRINRGLLRFVQRSRRVRRTVARAEVARDRRDAA